MFIIVLEILINIFLNTVTAGTNFFIQNILNIYSNLIINIKLFYTLNDKRNWGI